MKRKPPLHQVQFRIDTEIVKRVDARIEVVNRDRSIPVTRSDIIRAFLKAWASGGIELPA
jgi:hypothetical protein